MQFGFWCSSVISRVSCLGFAVNTEFQFRYFGRDIFTVCVEQKSFQIYNRCMFHKVRECEQVSESSHVLVHSVSACSGSMWFRLEPELGTPSRLPTGVLGPVLLPPREHARRKLQSGKELVFQHRHSDTECGHLKVT